MDQKPPNIVLPIVAAFVGLLGIVLAVTYYGSQQIDTSSPIIISTVDSVLPITATSAVEEIIETASSSDLLDSTATTSTSTDFDSL